jgi:Nif-specific regulatory protein/two-component system response regulator HydG
VIELNIPPLRARATDIPLLIEHYLRAHWKRPGERPRWTAEAERTISAHPFPGNVRELSHVIERACALATSPELGRDLLPPELAPRGPVEPAAGRRFTQWTAEELEAARESAVVGVEREFLDGLMKHCDGNVSQAARTSGIHRSQLQKLLARNRAG